MQFNFNGNAKIEHLNIRKEGDEESGKTLRVDMKVSALTDMSVPDYLDVMLRGFLWSHEGMARNPSLKAVAFTGNVGDCTAEMLGMTFTGVKVHKFSVEAADVWRARVVMTLTFEPSGTQVAVLSEHHGEETPLQITAEPSLLDQQAANDAHQAEAA